MLSVSVLSLLLPLRLTRQLDTTLLLFSGASKVGMPYLDYHTLLSTTAISAPLKFALYFQT